MSSVGLTGRSSVLPGARGRAARLLDARPAARAAARVVVAGGRLRGYQGDGEAPGGGGILAAAPRARRRAAGHVRREAARRRIRRQVKKITIDENHTNLFLTENIFYLRTGSESHPFASFFFTLTGTKHKRIQNKYYLDICAFP